MLKFGYSSYKDVIQRSNKLKISVYQTVLLHVKERGKDCAFSVSLESQQFSMENRVSTKAVLRSFSYIHYLSTKTDNSIVRDEAMNLMDSK